MTKYHLLGWIFKAYERLLEDTEYNFPSVLSEEHFKAVNAPDWVFPAYKERLKAYKESPDFK